jgi:tRNA wybutosine-synthesizing protein 2
MPDLVGKQNHKLPRVNPISAAVLSWLATAPTPSERQKQLNVEELLQTPLLVEAPKRWTIYEPMVLLPSGSFTSPPWQATLELMLPAEVDDLWRLILKSISHHTKRTLTHLAVNEAIPAATLSSDVSGRDIHDNILRSPVGIRRLHGCFGSSKLLCANGEVGQEDFAQAFWVSTKQNGIQQFWAPLWTMFSRGNVKEKARLLTFHDEVEVTGTPTAVQRRRQLDSSQLRGKWAVDLYAGIGYFVFSYVKLGLRVLAWDLNPWSLEGMRRGAVANGWSIAIFTRDDSIAKVLQAVHQNTQVIVFQEDNKHAETRIQDLWAHGLDLDVLHVNCGLLPSSKDSWRTALAITGRHRAWLHLHENVAVADIRSRQMEIQENLNGYLTTLSADQGRILMTEHVERVKTFAPDVWHCVFDVYSSENAAE